MCVPDRRCLGLSREEAAEDLSMRGAKKVVDMFPEVEGPSVEMTEEDE